MWKKLCFLDVSDRVRNQIPEFPSLLVADYRPEVLDLDQSFANEHHLSNFRDARENEAAGAADAAA
ncbi:MAG TPA: hypothetical protein VFJ47_11015 [Terriglobales bacterium]|nr:hypothetical protein [Terriglobales bacterium]